MRIIVTSSAGFIGSAIAMRLLARGDAVLGIDNHNSYYDPKLKEARAQRLVAHSNYEHLRLDLTDARQTQALFARFQPQVVVHMAAQAGVRYSITDPQAYVKEGLNRSFFLRRSSHGGIFRGRRCGFCLLSLTLSYFFVALMPFVRLFLHNRRTTTY